MRERLDYELPHPDFNGWDKNGQALTEPIFLPDYITVEWYSPVLDLICEAEIHPDRLEDFIENRIAIEGEGVIFYG
jgi:hypothetical protein